MPNDPAYDWSDTLEAEAAELAEAGAPDEMVDDPFVGAW